MRIECKREDLVAKLDLVSKVATRAHSLPVLQCVLLEASTDSIELRATNLELGVRATLAGTTREPGTVAVPAGVFLASVSLLSHPTVTLSTDGEVLVIESQGSVTKIKTFPADEFPPVNKIDASAQEVNGSLFATGIKTVLFAVSQSNIKPELGSVNIHQKEPHAFTFVATDSFRLAEKTVSMEKGRLDGTLLVPAKNAMELVRILETVGEDPLFSYTENQLAFSFPSGVYAVSRLVEGTFPDYEQIIPKEYQTHATVLVSDLAHALKKTNIFTNKFLQVSLSVDADTGSLTLASENTDAGTTREPVKAETEGESLSLSFNQHYLSDPLAHISDESVRLSFAGIGRPMVLRGVHTANFRYLVMPMNK